MLRRDGPSEQSSLPHTGLSFMHVLYSADFQWFPSILSPLFQFFRVQVFRIPGLGMRCLKTVFCVRLLLTIVLFTIALGGGAAPAQAMPFVPAAIPGLSQFFAGSAPSNLGLQREDHLAPCPATPNCILSQDSDEAHRIDPLTYSGDRARAYENLLKVLSVVPRTRIITQTDNYIRVEFESRLLGFVDDGEFYFPAEDGIIQVRSASRLGESDLGVNRTRMEQIRLALQDLGSRE